MRSGSYRVNFCHNSSIPVEFSDSGITWDFLCHLVKYDCRIHHKSRKAIGLPKTNLTVMVESPLKRSKWQVVRYVVLGSTSDLLQFPFLKEMRSSFWCHKLLTSQHLSNWMWNCTVNRTTEWLFWVKNILSPLFAYVGFEADGLCDLDCKSLDLHSWRDD